MAEGERVVVDDPVDDLAAGHGLAYWRALAAADRAAAVREAREALAEGWGAQRLLDLVCVAQARVGELWQQGLWSIAQEHAATSISEDVVAVVGTAGAPEPTRGTAVVACVDGEWHALPSRVLAETLRLHGWQVHHLGASVPAETVQTMAGDLGPDLVALSCSVSSALRRARAMVEASRAVGTPVLVGGRGFGRDGRWGLHLGATGWAPDAPSAAGLVAGESWPRFVDPAPPLRLPDDDAERVDASAGRTADDAYTGLAHRFPALQGYSDAQRRSTWEDLLHVARFLAAALLVDDVALLGEFLDWLADVLLARGVPLQGLVLGLECTAQALDAGPRAHAFLAAGLERLRARPEAAASA